jgi:hypothetical protein
MNPLRGGKKYTKDFEKWPYLYAWFHTDDGVCVARRGPVDL